MKIASFIVLCFVSVLEFLPNKASAASFFVISADHTEATDTRTGLIWRRCAEGMSIRIGTGGDPDRCTGTATTFTHAAALSQAGSQASQTRVAWRLPSLKELRSINDHTRRKPAIDPVIFPNTPNDTFWSSSLFLDSPTFAWFVNFVNGAVGHYNRTGSYLVRLVRTGQH